MLDATLPRPDLARPAALPLYVSDASQPRRRAAALEDVATGLRRWRLPAALARLDIRNRYRGSVLGPFWLTLSTAVMVVGLGLLYSSLFKMELAGYLPFIAVSLIVWNMISPDRHRRLHQPDQRRGHHPPGAAALLRPCAALRLPQRADQPPTACR